MCLGAEISFMEGLARCKAAGVRFSGFSTYKWVSSLKGFSPGTPFFLITLNQQRFRFDMNLGWCLLIQRYFSTVY